MRPPTDLILIQEPYFGRIGVNAGMAQGNPIYDVFGTVKHPDWQALVPPFNPSLGNPDVITYVPKNRTNWTFQLRTDLVSAPGLMCIQINSTSPSFLVFNVYNDVDNTACNLISSIPPSLPHSLFIGDFNLHHPLWSRDNNLDKQSDEADHLVELMASNGYNILNERGDDTFFMYRKNKYSTGHELYTSTLDLAWTSAELSHYVSNFQVAKHLGSLSDHHPLLVTLSYAPSQSTRTAFLFKPDRFEDWAEAFELELSTRTEIPEVIYTESEFDAAVTSLTGATLAASHTTCLWRHKLAKAAWWFNSKVRKALKDLRKARKCLFQLPSNHNALRFHSARKFFHYQVVVAKHSHARTFASTVKPGTDLWRLTSWYQGIRKTTVPTLKDPTSGPQYPTWIASPKGKADTLANTWFPNAQPNTKRVPHVWQAQPTRPMVSVTNEEVLDTLNECNNNNAPGLSGLTYRVWKWVAMVAPDQLISVVRASLRLGIHHTSWKQSLVAVIPKNNKKDMSLPKSHRPIQLIKCLGKLVKKIAAQ